MLLLGLVVMGRMRPGVRWPWRTRLRIRTKDRKYRNHHQKEYFFHNNMDYAFNDLLKINAISPPMAAGIPAKC